jgi:hypothetical protein
MGSVTEELTVVYFKNATSQITQQWYTHTTFFGVQYDQIITVQQTGEESGLFPDYYVSLYNVQCQMSVHTLLDNCMFQQENKWTRHWQKCCDTGGHPKFVIFSFLKPLTGKLQMHKLVRWEERKSNYQNIVKWITRAKHADNFNHGNKFTALWHVHTIRCKLKTPKCKELCAFKYRQQHSNLTQQCPTKL